MTFQHIQTRALRDYLLRTLPEVDADAIEQRYFADASFFRKLRAAEIELICDYLDNRLSEEQLERFKAHYLKVDLLKDLVARVQQERMAVRARRRRMLIALASALSCVVVIGVGLFRYRRPTSAPTGTHVTSVASPTQIITLILMPGTSKGVGSESRAVALPEQKKRVLLILKLPGQESSAVYTARLRNVDRSAGPNNTWSRNGLRSTSVEGMQQVEVELPTAFAEPGDYILELKMENLPVQETYQFRLIPPQK